MKNRRFLVLLCVSVQVLVRTVLAQQPDQHRATLIAQRKEIAKRYLAAAGLEPPEELDLAHLPQLRAEFNKFLSEPPQPPLSTGDQPAAAPDMHTETPNTNDTSKTVLDYLHPSPWNRFCGSRNLRLRRWNRRKQHLSRLLIGPSPRQPEIPMTFCGSTHSLSTSVNCPLAQPIWQPSMVLMANL